MFSNYRVELVPMRMNIDFGGEIEESEDQAALWRHQKMIGSFFYVTCSDLFRARGGFITPHTGALMCSSPLVLTDDRVNFEPREKAVASLVP